ncbi:MAG: AHH domain-containing protein [bacterium]
MRKSTCGCGEKYVKNCAPSPPWPKYPQQQVTKKGKLITRWRSHEAHHVLCVASVTKALSGVIAKKILRQTEWCINVKENMIALPMWAHTIQWYCTRKGNLKENVEKIPPFKNLPMHNSDHDSYIDEVDTKLENIVEKLEKKADNHEECSKQLKSKLNKLRDEYKNELIRRGKRRGGTHKAWEKGREKVKEWYFPFSMADDGDVTERTFPLSGKLSDGEIARKIEEYVNALQGISKA